MTTLTLGFISALMRGFAAYILYSQRSRVFTMNALLSVPLAG